MTTKQKRILKKNREKINIKKMNMSLWVVRETKGSLFSFKCQELMLQYTCQSLLQAILFLFRYNLNRD